MKKTDSLKRKILEELERIPIVQSACERCGVTRNTFYRWVKEDSDFANSVAGSKKFGVGLVSDVAEGGLFKGIKSEEPWAIKYFLSRRNRDYKTAYKIFTPHKPALEMSEEEIEKITKEIDEWFGMWSQPKKSR